MADGKDCGYRFWVREDERAKCSIYPSFKFKKRKK